MNNLPDDYQYPDERDHDAIEQKQEDRANENNTMTNPLTQQARETICESKYATRPILYTDTVRGIQTMRDDLWAVTTEELNILHRTRLQTLEEVRGMVEGNKYEVTGDVPGASFAIGIREREHNETLDDLLTLLDAAKTKTV